MKKLLIIILLSLPASAQITISVANAGSTGTTTNTLTKLTSAPSTAVITATSDTGGSVGITIAGAGTTGNAIIAIAGLASCVFENTTVAGDYVSIGSTTAGNCHDAGSTYPTSGQVIGRVQASGSAGTYTVDLFPAEISGFASQANTVTAAANYTNGDLVQAAGNNKTTSDSAIATANVVTAASNYTSGDLVQAAASNKTTSDSGVVAANVVTAASAAAGAKAICTSSGATKTCTFIDYPEVLYIPAANCNNTTAAAGWSIGSGGTVTCRAGSNNLGAYVAITDTSTTFATFQIELPEDWDSGTNPYIRVQFASTDATNGHTVIPSIQTGCYKGDGTTTDDVGTNAAHSLSTVTLNGNANRFWSTSNVQMNSTDVTGCVAGGIMQITIGRATDTATNAEFYGATVTIPRLLAVQAN